MYYHLPITSKNTSVVQLQTTSKVVCVSIERGREFILKLNTRIDLGVLTKRKSVIIIGT